MDQKTTIHIITIIFLVQFFVSACNSMSPTTETAEAAMGDSEAVPTLEQIEGTEWFPTFDGDQFISRWFVEITQDQDSTYLRETAENYFQSVSSVEPLFSGIDAEDDPYALSRIFIVAASPQNSQLGDWDIGYAFKSYGDFVRVEPEIGTVIRPIRQATAACIFGSGVATPDDPSWSLRNMKVDKAWDLTPGAGGKKFGEGIRICHPDTGWAEHADLDSARLDIESGKNFVEGGTDSKDPLNYLGHPGHGTATGSVIASEGGLGETSGTTGPGEVTGVAPAATIVPIRTMKNVVHLFDSSVAKAVRHAVDASCDVVSMSLGGRGFFGLKRAIRDAVSRGVIVVAAAGNCVGFMVAPASYAESIAVAATNAADKVWPGSSGGRAVTISAPGEDIYVARRGRNDNSKVLVKPGSGTSYSTAAVAGAAALWIAFHGKHAIASIQGQYNRQELFVRALQQSARRPSKKWKNKKYGPGIMNVEQLLKQDLPNLAVGPRIVSVEEDSIDELARMFDADIGTTREAITRMLGNPDDFEAELDQIGPELLYLAVSQPEIFLKALNAYSTEADPRQRRIEARSGISNIASETLRGKLQ